MAEPEIPPLIRAWIEQLLSLHDFIASHPDQVEVRLRANRGKVSRKPTIVLNGGTQELIAP